MATVYMIVYKYRPIKYASYQLQIDSVNCKLVHKRCGFVAI